MRQLADPAGVVTLTQSYAPYGEVTQSVGTSQTSYAFTGENLDANGLTYLRVRYLDSGTGRFTQRDPSGLEANLYLYAAANPVNRIDPSGLFSIQDIASSYDLDESQLLTAFSDGSHNSALEGKWGWLKLLLDAEKGQSIKVGAPTTFLPFFEFTDLDKFGFSDCDITIGAYNLKRYTRNMLDMPMQPSITWRNTKASAYVLNGRNYLDAERVRDLPDFRSVGGDLISLAAILSKYPPLIIASQVADINLEVILDRFGNVYIALGGALSGVEGYIAGPSPDQRWDRINGVGSVTEKEVKGTISGLCGNGDVNYWLSNRGLSVCASGGTAAIFGYSTGLLGFSAGGSYGFDIDTKIEAFDWDHIEERRGVTKDEALQSLH